MDMFSYMPFGVVCILGKYMDKAYISKHADNDALQLTC